MALLKHRYLGYLARDLKITTKFLMKFTLLGGFLLSLMGASNEPTPNYSYKCSPKQSGFPMIEIWTTNIDCLVTALENDPKTNKQKTSWEIRGSTKHDRSTEECSEDKDFKNRYMSIYLLRGQLNANFGKYFEFDLDKDIPVYMVYSKLWSQKSSPHPVGVWYSCNYVRSFYD